MPPLIQVARKKKDQWMESFHFRLAKPDALLQLAVLGLLTGFIAGGVIVTFRLVIESAQDYLLPGNGPENYEALGNGVRFYFPLSRVCCSRCYFINRPKGCES